MKNIGEQFEHIFMLSEFEDLLPEEILRSELLKGQLDDIFAKTEFENFSNFSNSCFAQKAFRQMKANNLDLVLEKHCEEDAVEVLYHQAGLYDDFHKSMLSMDLDPHSAVIILETPETEYSVVTNTNQPSVSVVTKDLETSNTIVNHFVLSDTNVVVLHETNESLAIN